jgi:hypothetical protein
MTHAGSRRRMACFAAVLAAVLGLQSCAALDEMASVLTSLQRLQFKIGAVGDFRLAGIALSGKTKLSQFSAADALKLVQSFAAKQLAADFVLEVLAVNPNDGTGGTTRTTSTLTGLESRLLIDGRPTVTGDIVQPVEIPGSGQAVTIPIRLSLDLVEFFGDKRYEDLVDLALAIGGGSGDATRVALDAQPRVTTPLGTMAYPGRITIVSAEFR